MVLTENSITSQLVDIYNKYEFWHTTRMTLESAYDYHQKRLDDGRIFCVVVDDVVLGYYEREFQGDECFLKNVFVMPGFDRGFVWKKLYKHFFRTMPSNIKYVTGDKVKLGGAWQKVLITKARSR
jgi:hypothetical protein